MAEADSSGRVQFRKKGWVLDPLAAIRSINALASADSSAILVFVRRCDFAPAGRAWSAQLSLRVWLTRPLCHRFQRRR